MTHRPTDTPVTNVLPTPVAAVHDALDACRHPRPRLRRPYLPLDGEWALQIADGPFGRPPADGHRSIVVPYAPESPASGIGDRGHHPLLWYRRDVELPAAWRTERLLLHLGGIEGRCDVWCQGERVASLERALIADPVDLTAAVAGAGTVRLELRIARDPLDLGAPRGKQDWEAEPHSIWYPRSSGITRTPWLEAVPAQHLERFDAHTDLAAFALDVTGRVAALDIEAAAGGAWSLSIRVRRAGAIVAEARWRLHGPVITGRLQLPDPGIDDARDAWLWSPERPNLLDLELELEADGVVVDRALGYTALRSVGVDDRSFLLNGRPYPLRLVLDQGYWPETHRTAPDAEALRRDVELTKTLGFNGVRKHQTIEDPRYYAWADRLGLLVWAELPSAYAFAADPLPGLTDTWRRLIERDRGAPCVVTWVAFNESWGVPDLPVRHDQRHAVRSLYHLAKALDPSRPTVGNDGWEYVVGDLLTVHDYAVAPERLCERYADVEAFGATLARFRPGGRRLVLDGDGETVAAPCARPVVLSEFGGVRAATEGDGWGYAQVDDGDALLERYRALMRAVHDAGALAGFCYTQLTDTFQEQNGLLSMSRRPKADPAALARATRGEEERTG